MPSHESFARDHSRPTGVIQPDCEPARRALRALHDNRLSDAEENITRIPQDSDWLCIWTQILRGMLALARRQTAGAEQSLRQAASVRSADSQRPRAPDADPMQRLSAFAWQQLGTLYRRQDRPRDAARAHQTAYDLRVDQGSYEELWESALALGLDEDLAGGHAAGQNWFRTAAASAGNTVDRGVEKQAIALTHLSTSLLRTGDLESAVEAADAARSHWHEHDITAPTAVQADMQLGHALLQLGASLLERGESGAAQILDQALEIFRGAKESFEAFGRESDADRDYCAEQIDFVERLRATMESE